MSSTVLALLVALVSVTSTAIPEIAELLKPSYSSVAVAKRGFKSHNIAFQLQNSGTEEASFLGATIIGSFSADSKTIDMEEPGAEFPIEPKSTRPLHIMVPLVSVEDFLAWPTDEFQNLSLQIRVQEYGGEVKEHDFSLSIEEYLRLKAATQEAFEQLQAFKER